MSELINEYASQLIGNAQLSDESIHLVLDDCTIRIRSNSSPLIERLSDYFRHAVVNEQRSADIEILAIERAPVALDVTYADWKREPGKSSRKDAYFDFPGARLVHKVRTGMLFLQSQTQRIAAGSCLKNDNQVINFINTQYMNWLYQRDWIICHAAGLVHNGRALGLAGFSGGGKSTLMLHMMENSSIDFMSNDRLFVKRQPGQTLASGVPKMPRINPGTIINNPRLQPLIAEQRRAELSALPDQELWQLEEKYDVDIETLYGSDRIQVSAPLQAFLVLNWKHDAKQPVQLNTVDLNERRDLLAAIMKSPGPFYQFHHGGFYQDTMQLDEQSYLDALQDVTVFEASGKVNFAELVQKLTKVI